MKKLAVIMPAYNSEKFISKSIETVLNQTYNNIIFIVVNDCSTDNTLQILKQYKDIIILNHAKNKGAYAARNTGLHYLKTKKIDFDYFTIHDSDDISDKDRFKRQIEKLEKENADGVGCNYNRIDSNTNKVTRKDAYCATATIYKRKIFNEFGYFDENRIGSDTEYSERLIKSGVKIIKINESLLTAYTYDNNLTTQYPLGCKERVSFIRGFKKLPNYKKSEKVTIGIATMPGREISLCDVLKSLVNQVDEIYVYFNNLNSVLPHFLTEIEKENSNVKFYFSENEIGDLTDFGGFYKIHEVDGYFISCDDDMIYQKNFVEEIVSNCKKYNDKCIVGYHGRTYGREKVKSYYHGAVKVHDYRTAIKRDIFVTIVAGMAMCFHTDTFKFDLKEVDYVKYPRMKDIHLAIAAQKQGISRVVLAHKTGFLRNSIKYDVQQSICRTEHKKDTKQVELFNSMNWKLLTTDQKHKKKVKEVEKKIWWITNKGGTFKQKRSQVAGLLRAGKIKELDINKVKKKIESDFEIEYEISNIK